MKNLPKVYIILVNYTRPADTIECLESVMRLDYPNYQVVVVDNASGDDSVAQIVLWAAGKSAPSFSTPEALRRLVEPPLAKPIVYNLLPEAAISSTAYSPNLLTIITANKNRGFAAGNNIGLRYALAQGDGDLYWLLNNDTLVEPNALAALVAYTKQEENTSLGIIGTKIRYYHQPDTLQAAGGAYYNAWLGYSRQIGNGARDQGQFDQATQPLDLILGASMCLTQAYMERVGLLYEGYFLYFEEQDCAAQARKAHLGLGYAPAAIVYHKEGSTIGGKQYQIAQKSLLSDFYYIRNKIRYTRRHHSRWHLLTVYLSFSITLLNRLRRRQWDRLGLLWRILRNPNLEWKDINGDKKTK